MVGKRIKALRWARNITQAELAGMLGVTRSAINAWELGVSVPSTQNVVELAGIFRVSTDYILGVEEQQAIPLTGLSEDDIRVVYALVEHLKRKNAPAE